MHNRSAIKQKVLDLLKDKTDVGERVYKNRRIPLPDNEDEVSLPAICIYAGIENNSANDNITTKRDLEILVECIAQDHEAEDVLDTLTNRVEYLLQQDETLGGLVSSFELEKTEYGEDDQAGAAILGARLTYHAIYYTEDVTDGSGLDDFRTADVKDEDRAFEDTVTLPQ